jgi:AcrR family transcriptional regulator
VVTAAETLPNRQKRTRKDLLRAAARLLAQGRAPGMEEVAAEAMVSRATAYRYFPNVEALLAESAVDIAMPEPRAFFAGDDAADVAERVVRAEAAVHDVAWRNEAPLRQMLAFLAQQGAKHDAATPRRQNRRTPLIHEALKPARDRLGKAAHDRLVAALAMIFGTESMIVFRDVLQLDEDTARSVKAWAVRALVHTALAEAEAVSARRARAPAARRRTAPGRDRPPARP